MTLDDLCRVWEGGDDYGDAVQLSRTLFVVAMGELQISSMEEFFEAYGTSTGILDRPDTDEVLDDGTGSGTDDWYTIKGRPWKCMGCGMSRPYIAEDQDPHRIVVWPKRDDPVMVRTLKQIREEDKEPAVIIRYESGMGPCVSHYALRPS